MKVKEEKIAQVGNISSTKLTFKVPKKESSLSEKKCLLKKTRLGKLAFCKDDFNFNKYSGYQIMECLKTHNVKHCVDCKFYHKLAGKDLI